MTMHLQPVGLQTYADKVNSQFNKSQSHYVSLESRLNHATIDAWANDSVNDSTYVFKKKYPSLTNWSQLTFCKALTTTLDLIDIDVTLQRMLDISHVCNILERFDPIKVMPICVYEDEDRPGRYVCWDSQHTAIVLYIIANRVLGITDMSNINVPMVIYASHQKSDMRNCFITLNGEGKKSLDHIDIVHQKIFGVRTDGSKNPDWVLTEQKYQHLENYKIFLTHEKFGDIREPGAYSRLDEFIDTFYNQSVTENFAKYFYKVCNSNRPVQPKESWMLYDYFQYCFSQKIKVDNHYIKEVADSLKVVGNNDFDSIKFYNRAKESYKDWWLANKPTQEAQDLRGISINEKKVGMSFLISQIAKHSNIQVPKYDMHWDIPSTDLF